MSDLSKQPEYIVEGIILRRLHEKRIEGYTIEMAKEISDAISDEIASLRAQVTEIMGVVQARINDYAELNNRRDLTEPEDQAWLAVVNLQREMEFALERAGLSQTDEQQKPYVPATEEEADEIADNGRNTGGKSYR